LICKGVHVELAFDSAEKTIDCWHFFAKARASFGKSQILYKFSGEYGFVEM